MTRSARILSVEIALEAAREIARRSRGTPRIANRLLRRVRDFARSARTARITPAVCHDALELLEVDQHGFDEADRRLLRTIIDKLGGGPVGLNSIAGDRRRKGRDRGRDEPFLIQVASSIAPPGAAWPPRAQEYFGLTAPGKERLW